MNAITENRCTVLSEKVMLLVNRGGKNRCRLMFMKDHAIGIVFGSSFALRKITLRR